MSKKTLIFIVMVILAMTTACSQTKPVVDESSKQNAQMLLRLQKAERKRHQKLKNLIQKT